MFCNQCGSPVSEIAIYCTKCGSKLQGNLAGQKVEVEDSSEVILQAETGAVKVSKSKLSKSKWLVLVITTIVIIGAYWYVFWMPYLMTLLVIAVILAIYLLFTCWGKAK